MKRKRTIILFFQFSTTVFAFFHSQDKLNKCSNKALFNLSDNKYNDFFAVNGGDGIQEDLLNNNNDDIPNSFSDSLQSRNSNNNENNNDDIMTAEVHNWTDIMTKKVLGEDSEDDPIKAKQIVLNGLASLSENDHMNIERYWEEDLYPQIRYLSNALDAFDRIKFALKVAYYSHRFQKRKSGEPFIIHPVQVAALLASLKMDTDTVISGLLHDTVEDTDLTFTQVEALFGPAVRSIVEGETKVSKLPKLAFSQYADEQAENLRQMFVAMTEDYRIIIVKLADRLHNMRTLRHMKPEKQIKISRETLDIFAPLAHRMGIWQFKAELEDTSFMYLYPKEYKQLNRLLRRHQLRFRDALTKSQETITKVLNTDPTLKEQGVSITVSGRTKELYSLWHKMETKHEYNLDHIADVIALRVVLNQKLLEGEDDNDQAGVWLCYHVLGLVQNLPGFQPVPTKVKDYISFPKPNGYQSLHTAIMTNGQMIEVQIRTDEMHRVAEYGMASHWAYKGETRGEKLYDTPWLSSIKEYENDNICSRDFVECVRRELLGKRVFVFLRNGKILNLARGATVVDAAFQIHTEVGLGMHGAEINGKRVPVSYELQNGDVVNILTGEGKPGTDWMGFAKVRSTRSKLRQYFRAKQKESLKQAGYIIVKDFLEIHQDVIEKHSFIEKEIDLTVEGMAVMIDEARQQGSTQYKEFDDFLLDIGKRHDRDFLRTFFSKLLKVPLNVIIENEKQRAAYLSKYFLSQSAYDAVKESRKVARDNASAAMDIDFAHENDELRYVQTEEQESGTATIKNDNRDDENALVVLQGLDLDADIADSKNLCRDCLPVRGDDIVGTRTIIGSNEEIVTVHRAGCIHARRAVERMKQKKTNRFTQQYDPSDHMPSSGNIDGSGLKNNNHNNDRFSSGLNKHQQSSTVEEPVLLKWPTTEDSKTSSYIVEVGIVAMDRKLLLADCSEVVSEIADIIRTGSSTTNEHAKLDFLVKVQNLDQLQELMDALGEIRSVMSVERKFGSTMM